MLVAKNHFKLILMVSLGIFNYTDNLRRNTAPRKDRCSRINLRMWSELQFRLETLMK
jgi:hypothetical protein